MITVRPPQSGAFTAPFESTAAPTSSKVTQTWPGRKRRSAPLGRLFRLPVVLYRVGLANELGRSTLLLTTRGRRTGHQRTTPLNYWTDGDVTYVLSGMGSSSDWLAISRPTRVCR
jgi:hypothetical protein